ncbi:MAG: RNA polymerase sigma factor [Ilumatobacteraceae bacterium]|nr:RNA polymerase sigma factor [Ilumatobacteraceae bacterium]
MTRSAERERLLAVYPSLRRFAAVVGSPDMSPDDLVHDVIVTALSGDRFAQVDDVEAYLRRSIVNRAANERRRLGRRRLALVRVRAEIDAQSARDAYPSDLSHLTKLDPRSRAVLFMHYVEGRSFEQIAALLDLRSPAVRQIAARARRELRLHEGVTP